MADETITIYDLDTTTLRVTLTTDGVAYDITGHTLSWIITPADSLKSLLQIDVTAHGDPDGGESSLTITPANIVTIGGPGNYTLYGIDMDVDDLEVTRVEVSLVVARRPARA